MELSDDDARAASGLLSVPQWNTYFKPRIEIRFKEMLNSLAGKKADDDDIKRGWVQALSWVMGFPQQDIDEYNKALEEQKAAQIEEQEVDSRATHGFRSPFVQGEREH